MAGTFGPSRNCKPEVYWDLPDPVLMLTGTAAVTFKEAGSFTPAAAISRAAACRSSLVETPLLFLYTQHNKC